MPGNKQGKRSMRAHQLNCLTSQFNTIKLAEKRRTNECPHCLKTFVKPSGLKAHIFSHTGEKPHKCPAIMCGRYFSLLSNLRRHMKIHNRGRSRNRLSSSRRTRLRFHPLLPVSPSLKNQYDYGNRTDQERCHPSHGIAPNYDHAYYNQGSLIPEGSSPLPAAPLADDTLVFPNDDDGRGMETYNSASLVNDDPIFGITTTPSLDGQPFGLQLPTTQGNFQGAVQIHAPHFQPSSLEHPPWTTSLFNVAHSDFSIELDYLQNINYHFLTPQQPFYPHDFF